MPTYWIDQRYPVEITDDEVTLAREALKDEEDYVDAMALLRSIGLSSERAIAAVNYARKNPLHKNTKF